MRKEFKNSVKKRPKNKPKNKPKKAKIEEPVVPLNPVDYSNVSSISNGKVFVLKNRKGNLDRDYGLSKKLLKKQTGASNVPFGKRKGKRKK